MFSFQARVVAVSSSLQTRAGLSPLFSPALRVAQTLITAARSLLGDTFVLVLPVAAVQPKT